MKIMVTGGAGFIGSAVIRLAIMRGHSIINVDSLSYAACLKNLADVVDQPNYTFAHVDIRDQIELDHVFTKYTPDAVMHLAAETHVDRSIDGPQEFIQTNINGTFNLLEVALKYWQTQGEPSNFRFHHISTDEVFGSLGTMGMFTENTPYDPRSPYAASKASSDHLVKAWYETFGLPILLTNSSNNYGPYQFPEKLIPVLILNALAGKALPIYGNGSNIRDWLYVEDHANALLLVLENGEVGRRYNIGSGNEKTNLEIVRALCDILDFLKPSNNGSYSNLISFVPDRPGHDFRYAIDYSRVRNELGWKPSVTLEEGLTRTVQWYLENEEWWRSLLEKIDIGKRLGAKS